MIVKPFSESRQWRHASWAVLICGVAVTVACWRTIVAHERVEIGWATQLGAEAIKADLIEDMEWQRIGLDRLALLWAASSPNEQLWRQNAELYIEHRPGCVAVEWIADKGDKHAIFMPLRTNPHLAFDGYPKDAMAASRLSRATVLSTTAALPDGTAQYVVVQPVYNSKGRLLGFVLAFFDVGRSIRANLMDVTGLGFSFAVQVQGQPDWVLPDVNVKHERDWGITVPVPLPGDTWHLRVWPNPDAFNRIQSILPQLTLIFGFVLSGLTFLTVYFAMRVARSNTALQREIAVREGIENELRRTRDQLEQRVQERTAELGSSNVLLQTEVAEHERTEKSLRELTGRIFQLQDDERRRLARELHDGATQNLVALAMEIAAIRDAVPADGFALLESFKACERRVRQCTEELRTVSYLLHPPLLSELGLVPALQEFAEGFAARSGIRTTVNVDSELGRMDAQVELSVFRVVQEALTNVYRHAHSRTAAITLMRNSDFLHLEIADAGRGMPAEVLAQEPSGLAGVGVAGMRERVRLLGGSMDIQSGAGGTLIRIVLPLSFAPAKRHALIPNSAYSSGSNALQ